MKKTSILTGLALAALLAVGGTQWQSGFKLTEQDFSILPASMNTFVAASQDLSTAVPDGQEITIDEFRQRAGDDVANMLAPLNPTKIRRDGTRFTLSTTPATINNQGVTVYVAAQVACEVSKNGNTIALRNIDGVDVKLGALGTRFKLREAVITANPGGKTAQVDGKLEVSRWLPYVPFSLTVDLDKVKQP